MSKIIKPGLDLFSRRVAPQLSSALDRFTTLFGMGRGGSDPLKRPGKIKIKIQNFAFCTLRCEAERLRLHFDFQRKRLRPKNQTAMTHGGTTCLSSCPPLSSASNTRCGKKRKRCTFLLSNGRRIGLCPKYTAKGESVLSLSRIMSQPISTARLKMLPFLHLPPINQVVSLEF